MHQGRPSGSSKLAVDLSIFCMRYLPLRCLRLGFVTKNEEFSSPEPGSIKEFLEGINEEV